MRDLLAGHSLGAYYAQAMPFEAAQLLQALPQEWLCLVERSL